MDTKEQRFVETEAQSGLRGVSVLVDRQTGVQYLFHFNGNAAGLTVLVDAEGKPLLYRKTPDAPEF